MRGSNSVTRLALLFGLVFFLATHGSIADDKALIDANTQRALAWIRDAGGDTAGLFDRAAGVLVFPDMVEMGFGVGGEFGEGVLVIGGETVAYYAAASRNYGHLPDAEYKAKVIFFMTEEALQAFRDTQSWQVGEDATVAVMTDFAAVNPTPAHVGLIFSEDGMIADLGFDDVRVTRVYK
jgi:lipid-binding SYLF domain-containing protein